MSFRYIVPRSAGHRNPGLPPPDFLSEEHAIGSSTRRLPHCSICSAQIWANPLPVYQRLRHRIRFTGMSNSGLIVTRYRDVSAPARSPDFGDRVSYMAKLSVVLSSVLLRLHRRSNGLFRSAQTHPSPRLAEQGVPPHAVEAMRPRDSALVDGFIDMRCARRHGSSAISPFRCRPRSSA